MNSNRKRHIWVISDTHFFHQNILKFEDDDGRLIRPGFSDVNHMNETIIQNWNSVVMPGDKVYHLGDVFFGARENYRPIIDRLNGKLRIILGNHDDVRRLIEELPKSVVLDIWRVMKEFEVIMTHIPIHDTSGRIRHGKLYSNVHGHIHQNLVGDPSYVNVCVEHTNYTPVNLETIRDAQRRKLR